MFVRRLLFPGFAALSGLAVLLPSPVWACEDAVGSPDIAAWIDAALTARQEGDLDGARAYLDLAQGRAGCTTEPLEGWLIERLALTAAIVYADFEVDALHDQMLARALARGGDLSLAGFDAASQTRIRGAASAYAAGSPLKISAPDTQARLVVDGSPLIPTEARALLPGEHFVAVEEADGTWRGQWVTLPEASPAWQGSRAVLSIGEPMAVVVTLPPPIGASPTPPRPRQGAAFVSAGVLAVGGLTLWGLSALETERFEDELECGADPLIFNSDPCRASYRRESALGGAARALAGASAVSLGLGLLGLRGGGEEAGVTVSGRVSSEEALVMARLSF